MDHNNNNDLASASFDVMNGPPITTQIINTVMPSIPAISNNILNTSTETITNDYKKIHNDIANSNADFDLSIDDLSFFWIAPRKMMLLCNLLS